MTASGTARPAAPHHAAPPRSLARNSATVATWTLVSRATGLLRVVVIGAVLGATYFANAFVGSNQVPSLAYSIVAGQVLALVVVPAVVRSLHERGVPGSALHVRRLSGLLVTASGAVAVLLVPASVGLAWALTLGVPPGERGEAHVVTTILLLLVAPQVVLYTVAALGAAAQQARGRFALAAAAPAAENVGLMATMLAVAVLYETPGDVGEVPVGLLLLVGTGATLSVGVHAGLQVFGAARAGLSLRPARGWWTDPEVRAVAGRLRGSVLVAAMPAGSLLVLLAFAATFPGGVLLFQIAFAVYAVPTALGARAVTTAVLPAMSAAVRAGDARGYAAAWRQALSYGVTVGLPALCVLVVCADPVARVLAAGELSTAALVSTLAVAIAVMGGAQLASAVNEIGRQALYARLDVRGPQAAGLIGFGVTAAGGTAALLLPAGAPRLAGLCAVVLLADAAAAAVLVTRVRRAIRPQPVLDVRRLGFTALAAATMVPILASGRALTGADPALRDLAVLTVGVALATAAFAGVLRALLSRQSRQKAPA